MHQVYICLFLELIIMLSKFVAIGNKEKFNIRSIKAIPI